MVSESEVARKLADLNDGNLSVAAFDQWIKSVGWNLHKSVPVGGRVYDLIRDIQVSLAEYWYDPYDEAELRRELVALAHRAREFALSPCCGVQTRSIQKRRESMS